MNAYGSNPRPVTLRDIFNRKLLLLLVSFSLVTSIIIFVAYQNYTDKRNRNELGETLNHMVPRIKDLDRRRKENANHLLSIIEWSGMTRLSDSLRNEKLKAFFTAQSEGLGYEGILITDARTGKLLFDYWSHTEKPHMQAALAYNEGLWVDQEHSVLYSRIKKTMRALHGDMDVYFFRAWDSASLQRLSFPDTTAFISIGGRPILSSAGSLMLESSPPIIADYTQYNLNAIRYQEGSTRLDDVALADGRQVPLKLIVRSPIKNQLPVQEVLGASLGMTLLFGVLVFAIFGRWLRQIGQRLDILTDAVLQFHNGQVDGIARDPVPMLKIANARKHDQISVIAQELSTADAVSQRA